MGVRHVFGEETEAKMETATIREMRKNMSDKLPLARGAAQADSRYNDAAHRLVKRQAVDASRLDGDVRWLSLIHI